MCLNIVIDDFEQRTRDGGDGANNLAQSAVAERRRNAAGVNSAHGAVRPVLAVVLRSALLGNNTIENDVDEEGCGSNIGDGSES